MLYRELVEFDPIETVIRLREANQRDRARQLVQTYVISERMADRLANLVIPQLDLDRPRDNKGVLIVGNYGTGKSHLMAVLAALAEFPDLTGAVTDPQVAAAAGAIAGRFKVVRVEVGAVERSLRDILLDELQKALETWGTPYRFPPASQVGNNKDLIIAAVVAFQRTYPGMGILLVVDELLDYLRSREERQLILDLGFLRELGEVSSETAFRFIGGLQETLFDSPRFAFVAGQLRRVRDRFEQILIAREDIAYVISHRLLKKNDAQLAWIRDHLRRFEPLYAGLSERMGEFAALYPIHPAYIETFQDMFIAEKRQALVTFSQAMAARLDEPVPDDEPGTISFDHYWGVLRDDPSLRSVPDVAKVIDASRTLEGLVRSSYTRPHLLPMAQRIIHALSVHRLTTDDIRAPVGLTAEALRDRLFLYGRTPQRTADSLLMEVQVALREIHRTVSGQFMLHSEENGQYWLDPYIIVNVPAQIEQRSEMLGADERNRYFYDALRQVLGLSTSTYVTNFRIWFYELPWTARRVTRPGYLFFGLPSERSTAQPPRDFYVYILPPFGSQNWQDEERPDEVILRLAGVGDDFTRKVALYAGARDLSMTSVDLRQEYAQHAETHLRELAFWLRENLVQHLQVTFEGVTRPAREVLAESRSSASESVRDVLDIVAAHCLEPTFEDRYPDYPAFTRATANITEEARENTAIQAVRAIAGYRRTQLVEAVLDGLRLLDDRGAIRPYD
ncbi:MAG: ATP-binding protein, partial [Chloroflexi bacterium]|nr:ATP-binding protein [Chloroflexota bacterium]